MNVRRVFALLLLGAGMSTGAGAADPALSADVTGAVRWLELPDAPPVQSRLQVQRDSAGKTQFQLEALAPGLAVTLVLTLPMGQIPGSWSITEGEVDLGVWWRLSASRFAADLLPSDFTATGKVKLTGTGSWQEGDFNGTVSASVENGVASSAGQGWSANGIAFTSESQLEHNRPILRTGRLTAETIQAVGVVGRGLTLDATGEGARAWKIQNVQIEALGGRIELAPFKINLDALALDVTATLSNLALADLTRFVPQALSSAQGRLSGKQTIRWTPQSGFLPGQGSLRVAPDEGATLRLASKPGFLTNRVPGRIPLLGGLVKLENPARPTLQQIEEGRTTLLVETLQVELYPDGVNGERTASVHVTASPPAGSNVKTVRFNVEVTGPLEELLKLGLDKRVDLSVGVK